MENYYYSPGLNGFTILGEEDYGQAYEPWVFVVFRRESDGKLFWGTGASCSCYGPMDDCNADTIKPLPETLDELLSRLPEHDTTILELATGVK